LVYQPELDVRAIASDKATYLRELSPDALRYHLLQEIKAARTEERSVRVDGIALSKRLAHLWDANRGFIHDNNNGHIHGWPNFLEPVQTNGRVFRKWCKDAPSMNDVIQSGLTSAHSGLFVYNEYGQRLRHYPFVQGAIVTDRDIDKSTLTSLGYWGFKHYVDFVLPQAAEVFATCVEGKYIIPGIARVSSSAIDSAIRYIGIAEAPRDDEPYLIKSVRLAGQMPSPFFPIGVVDYGFTGGFLAASAMSLPSIPIVP
jgi:hypothetical protein